jgi:hypothetical protein
MSNLDTTQVTTLVDTFIANHATSYFSKEAGFENQFAQLVKDRDSNAHDLVAELVDLAEKVSADVEHDGVKQFIIARSCSPAKGDNNRFGPFIQAVFSEKKNGNWTKHDKEKSLAKHANHVRYLLAKKRAGKINGTVQDFIRNHPKVGNDSGLRAIEAQDRLDNPSKAQATRVSDTRSRGMNAQPVATVTNPIPAKDGDLVKLWGRVSQGQIEIMQASVANDDADSLWYKLGTTIPVK